MSRIEVRASGRWRAVEILGGIIVIALAIFALAYPQFTIQTLVIVIVAGLILGGLRRITVGVGRARRRTHSHRPVSLSLLWTDIAICEQTNQGLIKASGTAHTVIQVTDCNRCQMCTWVLSALRVVRDCENTVSSVKIARKIATCLLIFLTTSAIGALYVSPTKAQQSIGIEGLKQRLHSLFSSIDQQKAISLARGSPEFQSQTIGHAIQFHSIFLTWSVSSSLSVNSLVWNTVNVVFSYHSATTGLKNVVATIDPGLSKVISVETQDSFRAGPAPTCNSPVPQGRPSPQDFCNPPPPPPPCTSTSAHYSNWAGYTLKTACPTSGISFVYEAHSTWGVPAVSEPWNTACQYYHCDVAIWPGLTDDLNGHDYIAQLGSQSGVYCGLGSCGYYYNLWYEFFPDNSQNCAPTAPGDQISADVWNEIENGGSSQNWDFQISDTQPSGYTYGCYTVINKNYPLPQYGQFIAERPHYCIGINCVSGNYDARLPQFNSFRMTALMNERNPSETVTGYTAYNNKWYTVDNMTNCDQTNCYTNLSPSAIDAGSGFTINYGTSTAT